MKLSEGRAPQLRTVPPLPNAASTLTVSRSNSPQPMIRFYATFPFLLGAVIFPGCHRPAPPAAASVATPAAITQWSGTRGGPEKAGTRTIRTAAGWEAFWKEVGREAPAPWTTDDPMAVAVFLGQKRTAGYSINITGSRIENGRLVIDYRETAPAPDTMVAQMLTAPWAIARVPRSELPVVALPAAPAPAGPQPK